MTELDRAIEAAQRPLDRILFIAFAEDRGLLPDRNLLNRTAFVRVAGLTGWQAFQLLFRSIDKGDPLNGIPSGACGQAKFQATLKLGLTTLASLTREDVLRLVAHMGCGFNRIAVTPEPR